MTEQRAAASLTHPGLLHREEELVAAGIEILNRWTHGDLAEKINAFRLVLQRAYNVRVVDTDRDDQPIYGRDLADLPPTPRAPTPIDPHWGYVTDPVACEFFGALVTMIEAYIDLEVRSQQWAEDAGKTGEMVAIGNNGAEYLAAILILLRTALGQPQ